MRRQSRGQAATEFAIAVPVALAILFAIMEFGIIIHAYSFTSDAARDAVRYAIVHGATSQNPATQASLQSLVDAEANGIDTANLTVNPTWTPSNQPGSTVAVQVSYTFYPLYPLSNAPLTMSSTAQMIISQ